MELIEARPGGVIYAVYFEGDLPSESDFKLIEREQYGIRIAKLPADRVDVDFLAPAARFLTHLDVTDGRCTDVRIVEEFSLLTELSLNVKSQFDIDLRGCSMLNIYFGPHRRFESLEQLSMLRELSLYPPIGERIANIQSPLRTLALVEARAVRSLPVIRNPQDLWQISIDGPKVFDLSSLVGYPALSRIYLHAVGELTGLEALGRLPALSLLGFDKVRSYDAPEALLALSGVRIAVYGSRQFDAEFRSRAQLSTSDWSFD